jgi:hypothetical protein
MYWYLKNLLKETISRKNLYEILRNKVQRNFVEFRKIEITFFIDSYSAKNSYFATILMQTLRAKPKRSTVAYYGTL